MPSLLHHFVGGVLLSSSSSWLQYFVGHNFSGIKTVTSFISGDAALWRWSMILGMINCAWAVSLLSPSTVEGIGGWTLQAPKMAILAGSISGIGAKLCLDSGYEDPFSAYAVWSKETAYFYAVSLAGALATSLFVKEDAEIKLPAHKYELFPSFYGSAILLSILGIQVLLFKYMQNLKTSRYVSQSWKEAGTGYICGVYFGLGLSYAGLLCPSTARNFVTIQNPSKLDLSWIAVIVGAYAARFVFLYVVNMGPVKRPVFNSRRRLSPTTHPLQQKQLFGSGITGIGWALKGLSVGPAMLISTCRPSLSIVSFFFSYIAGYLAADRVEKLNKN